MRVVAHHVPQDWADTDVHQWLRDRLGMLTQTSSETATEQYNLHCTLLLKALSLVYVTRPSIGSESVHSFFIEVRVGPVPFQ